MVLLDIHMDYELEGIAIAQKVAETYRIPFIYITAHSDKDIINKALETKPFGYITKPIKKMDVYAAITIALKHIEGQEENILVFKDGYATVKLSADEIFYAKSEGNYIDIITANKKYTLRNSLEWFTEQLPEQQFVRVHRSYVANIKKITKQTSGTIYMQDHIIPISRNKQIGLAKF
jgi:two-component system, LytTR family, response regulator LytT